MATYSLLLKMLFCFANVSIITIQTSILLEKVGLSVFFHLFVRSLSFLLCIYSVYLSYKRYLYRNIRAYSPFYTIAYIELDVFLKRKYEINFLVP